MINTIKKVAIVGRDADAWIAALYLQQALAGVEPTIEVVLIELPAELTRQDFFSVMPAHKLLHKVLGANERLLLKEAKGHYCFAQRFSNWCGGAAPYMHAYDRFGLDFNGIDFYQYWLKAKAGGLKVSLEDFNLGAVAAKQQKYVVFDESATIFSHASCGYHLSAIEYIKAIAKGAMAKGLQRIQACVSRVNTDGEKITSVVLTDGQEVRADLFIDASGSDAVLIKEIENNNIEKWSHWLPVDHIMVASAPVLSSPPSFSQVSAFKDGWLGIYPLLDRTAISFSYSSKSVTPEKLAELASVYAGMPIMDVTDTPFSAGARKKAWIGNCIALGSTAVSLEALDAVHLHPLHVGLSLISELFPRDKYHMPEADIFNHKFFSFMENIRDFQIAHYHLNKRYGEPFWDSVRNMDIPESLKHKIELFVARGAVSMNDNETFLQENWISLFVGQKLDTKAYDPLVNLLPEQDLIENFQKLLTYIKNEIEHMPSMQAYVEMNLI
jgi:tryptophan 7-halogenase